MKLSTKIMVETLYLLDFMRNKLENEYQNTKIDKAYYRMSICVISDDKLFWDSFFRDIVNLELKAEELLVAHKIKNDGMTARKFIASAIRSKLFYSYEINIDGYNVEYDLFQLWKKQTPDMCQAEIEKNKSKLNSLTDSLEEI